MKKILFITLALLSVVAMQAQTYWNGTSNKVFSGSGTQADPYLISTPEQLAGLAERTNVDKEDFAGKYLKLTADIYLTNFNDPDTANWKQWEPIAHSLMQWGEETDYGYFRGHFDGNGHTVYNLYYGKGMNWADDWNPQDLDLDLSSYDFSVMNKALFVNLDGGTIENLNIANAKMAGVNQALLVLNAEANSVIRNCHVEGEIRGTQSGCYGLVNNNKGLIENCSATVNTNLQGGAAFVGTNEATGVIRNCTSDGFMRCTMGAGAGFVSSNTGLIEKCTANVHIQALGGPDAQTNAVGGHTFNYRSGAGFVLENSGTIRECAALGGVDGEGTSTNYVWASAIAGFAYRNWNGRIESSYCTGALRDVSDSTGVGGDPTIAMFCYNNGENAQHQTDDAYRGDIFNCYTTSTIRHHDANYYRNSIHPFIGKYHDFGGFNTEYQGNVEPSQQIGCFFANEGLPTISEQSGASWNGIGMPLADMKTQAFVNKLNQLAAFFGTSQWELRDGLPRPTGVYQPVTAGLLGGGDGTKNNPYLISTKEHLENLALLSSMGMTFFNQYIKQTADIALNAPFAEWEYTAPTAWTPIAAKNTHPYYSTAIENWFLGTYDGDFHKVENMYINSLTSGNYGLFSYVGKNAVVRNLKVTDAYIRADGNIGILTGYLAESARIIQCHTSGDVEWKTNNGASIGAFTGELGAYVLVLNCSSEAKMVGGGAYNGIGIVHGSSFHVWSQDTCINFLFTGNINNGERCIVGSSYAGFQYNENEFIDRDKHPGLNCGKDGFHGRETTQWLQSKEFVNLLNYGVSRWNARHDADLQLNYWQFNEGEYPTIAVDAAWRPEVAIAFNSNGGAAVPTKYVYANSEALAPQRPLRDGYLFAGWYKDAGLTQFYEWKAERPTASMTLYARWREDQRWDVDLTPFQNDFAKTYHIQTAAQLRGLMALQNGLYDWGEKNDCNGNSNKLMYPTNPISQTLAPVSFAGKTIVLDNDIILCDTTDWQYWGRGAFGLPWKSIGSNYGVENESEHRFQGTFDGQGHVIYGLYQENTGMPMRDDYGGFFGWVGDGAVIKNVGIAASCLDYQNYDTRGVYDDATKYWLQCGVATQGNPSRVGMMAGFVVDSVTFDQCYTEGNIFVQSNGFYGLGGFIGQLGDEFYYNIAKITNCYSRVNIHNTSPVDTIDYNPQGYGFAVFGKQIPITKSYSAGHTHHSFANANNSYGDQVANCYYDKELVNVMDSYSWGGVHYIGGPKTTNEMHAKATFVDWDFENIWGRNEAINDGYPYLRVFYEGAPADSEDPIVVTGITLNVTDTTVIGGSSFQLIATILPEDAQDKRLSWSISDSPSWYTIDENGFVTTYLVENQLGYANTYTITVTSHEGDYKATCKLKIVQPRPYIEPMAYRRIGESEWVYKKQSVFFENFEYMMIAYTTPDATNHGFNWSVSDEQILSVTPMADTTCYLASVYGTYHCARAIVRAKQQSETAAQVYASLPSGLRADYGIKPYLAELAWISIYQPPTYEAYYGTVYPEPETEMEGGSTRQLGVQVKASYMFNGGLNYTDNISYLPTIQWSSSNTNVLTVDQEGLVTAVGAGSATITATAVGTEISSTTAQITVQAVEAQSITINEYTGSNIEIREGETFQLTATVLPENTTDKTVTWESSNTNYATVDQNGLVTAVKGSSYGNSVTVYARSSKQYVEAYAYFKIKDIPVEDVILNTHELVVYIGESLQLEATVLPENASSKSIYWSTTNYSAVEVVSGTGVITAKAAGTADIVARAGDSSNGYHYDTCHVTVKPHELILSEHELTLYVGETYQLEATTIPESNLNVTWITKSSIIASVKNGLVTAKKAGNTQIIARISSRGTYVYDTCEVTVRLHELILSDHELSMYVSDTYQLDAMIIPESNLSITWSSKSTAIASVSNGLVTAKKAGNTQIIARISSGETYVYDTCEVSVLNNEPQPTSYTIRFLNYDGTELQNTQVLEGNVPTYNGTTPTKPQDEQYIYTFIGWQDTNGVDYTYSNMNNLPAVSSNMDYTAQYRSAEIPKPSYTITFVNWDGELLEEYLLEEGTMPVYTGVTPTRPEDEDYTYEFCGWLPEIVAAVANADYTAQFTATEKSHEGIEDIPASDTAAPQEILINGTIYILRGEHIFTIQGQKVR